MGCPYIAFQVNQGDSLSIYDILTRGSVYVLKMHERGFPELKELIPIGSGCYETSPHISAVSYMGT